MSDEGAARGLLFLASGTTLTQRHAGLRALDYSCIQTLDLTRTELESDGELPAHGHGIYRSHARRARVHCRRSRSHREAHQPELLCGPHRRCHHVGAGLPSSGASKALTASDLHRALAQCTKLSVLNLSMCRKLTDTALGSLGCLPLKGAFIQAHGCIRTASNGLMRRTRSELSLSFSRVSDRGLAMLCSGPPASGRVSAAARHLEALNCARRGARSPTGQTGASDVRLSQCSSALRSATRAWSPSCERAGRWSAARVRSQPAPKECGAPKLPANRVRAAQADGRIWLPPRVEPVAHRRRRGRVPHHGGVQGGQHGCAACRPRRVRRPLAHGWALARHGGQPSTKRDWRWLRKVASAWGAARKALTCGLRSLAELETKGLQAFVHGPDAVSGAPVVSAGQCLRKAFVLCHVSMVGNAA